MKVDSRRMFLVKVNRETVFLCSDCLEEHSGDEVEVLREVMDEQCECGYEDYRL